MRYSLGGVNFGNVNFVIVRSFDRDRIKKAVSIVQDSAEILLLRCAA